MCRNVYVIRCSVCMCDTMMQCMYVWYNTIQCHWLAVDVESLHLFVYRSRRVQWCNHITYWVTDLTLTYCCNILTIDATDVYYIRDKRFDANAFKKLCTLPGGFRADFVQLEIFCVSSTGSDVYWIVCSNLWVIMVSGVFQTLKGFATIPVGCPQPWRQTLAISYHDLTWLVLMLLF